MTDCIPSRPDHVPTPDPAAQRSPGQLQVLLRTPDYLVPSAILPHVPFLFWLCDALQPRRIRVLGLGDGVAHFALCQALAAPGAEGRCRGFALVPEGGAEVAVAIPAPVRTHERQAHKDRSRLVGGLTFGAALDRIGAGGTDLLFLDLEALPAGTAIDAARLAACLATPGILVLHGTNAPAMGQAALRRLVLRLGPGRPLEFTQGQGVIAAATDAAQARVLDGLRGGPEGLLRGRGAALLALAVAAVPAPDSGQDTGSAPAEAEAALSELRAALEAERKARFEETTTLTQLAEVLRAELATARAGAGPGPGPGPGAGAPGGAIGSITGLVTGRTPGQIHVLQADPAAADLLRGQLLPAILQPEPGPVTWIGGSGGG